MIQLTTALVIPNVNRAHVVGFIADDGSGNSQVMVMPRAGGVDGPVSAVFLSDAGNCVGVDVTAGATGLVNSLTAMAPKVIAGAATAARAAYRSGGSDAAALKALETLGLSAVWLGPGLTGVVS